MKNIFLNFRQRQVGVKEKKIIDMKKIILKNGVNGLVKIFQIREKKKSYQILQSKADIKHLEIIFIMKLNGMML